MVFPPINRRKFIKRAAVVGVAAIAADSTLIEPDRPRLIRKEIALRRWPSRLDGFTIALLSDFHYDPYFSVHPIRSAVEIVSGLRPDLIALTGDFVSVPLFGNSAKGAADAEPCAQLLGKLRAPHGVWSVLGNHDVFSDADRVTNALHAVGISTLLNRSIAIEKDGARFWLGGVDDVLGGSADVPGTLRGIPSEEAAVLMAHEPDYADYVAGYPVDLQLSGHTHGGQVRFPFVGPLVLPALAKKYVWGLFKIRDLTLYTNAGIGTVELPVRWNCPPEITFITVRKSPSA
ncbi:MAG: metallophosphoesterase [Acidobacteriia bacterium]|nr:metallophosphoesterase [Terriglobia bacterium]